MKSRTLQLARWAVRIRTQYQRQADERLALIDRRIVQVDSAIHSLTRIRRRLAECRDRGWKGAAKSQLEDLCFSLRDLHGEANDCQRAIDNFEKPVPDPRHFLQELEQLETEFGEIEFDTEHNHLSVTTEPITLEGIPLGRFELRLELNRTEGVDVSEQLRIMALEPNPAASNESVTHPHVRDERLCAGDASAAMNSALASGRLCDLFLLARSVLENYNSESPFVPLSKWDGFACNDCGVTMTEEESCWCSGCQADFCEECSSFCRTCDSTHCLGCLGRCSCCDDLCCERCLSRCLSCNEACCPSCLDETRCSECQPGDKTDDQPHTPTLPNSDGACVAAGTTAQELSPQAA